MKKYKVWIECERTIEANTLVEAIEKFDEEGYEVEIHGIEI